MSLVNVISKQNSFEVGSSNQLLFFVSMDFSKYYLHSLIAGSLESVNSSILAAHSLFLRGGGGNWT